MSPNGSKKIEFDLRIDSKVQLHFGRFGISPTGEVVASFYTKGEKDVFLVRFDSDGKPGTPVRLESPPFLLPTGMAVFANGNVLFEGYFTPDASRRVKQTHFLAVFQSDGRLVGRVSTVLPDKSQEEFVTTLGLKPNLSVASPDGNIYHLRGTRVLVINPYGKITRSFNVELPTKEHSAGALFITGGTLAVMFNVVKKNAPVTGLYVRSYIASTGEVSRDFLVPNDVGNTPLCLLEDGSITFFQPQKGKFGLIRAAAN